MKKFLLPAVAVTFIYLVSCNQTASSSNTSSEQQNLSADSIISEAFHTGDVSKIDSVVAEDFLDHTDHGDVKGRDSLKAMIKMMKDSVPDMKMTLINRAANDDYVYSYMNFTGNSNGAMGIPPGPYSVHTVELVKYKDGKAVEHWGFWETREVAESQKEMMQMINKTDTTKMKK
jgi:predicted SnoaL-like aldol condensation-catalyzing enzyme